MSEGRFVEEVGRVLSGRALAVYDRKSGLPEWKREAYLRILKGERPAPPPSQAATPNPDECPYLEPGARRKVGCLPCRKRAKTLGVDAFRCAKYDCLTTLEEPGEGAERCCRSCPDNPANVRRTARTVEVVRGFRPSASPVRCEGCSADLGTVHLLYHLLPVAENDVWLRNLSELAARSRLFTGRKLFAVMTGGGERFVRGKRQGGRRTEFTLVDLDLVRRNLPPDAEVLPVPNDPELREVASWGPLWDGLLGGPCSDSDRVFYAHAKGVTRDEPTTRLWTERMYSVNLDHPRLVAEGLARHDVVGAFRKVGRCFDSRSEWHYSGSFFWSSVGTMREALERRPVARKWWGNEAWPGSAFPVERSGVLFGDGGGGTDLYRQAEWDRIEPEYRAWLEGHR